MQIFAEFRKVFRVFVESIQIVVTSEGGAALSSVFIEILIIMILLVTNGALAAAEIALVSSKRVTLQQRYNNGDVRASVALDLMNNPNKLFSTIQIGITVIGIVAGAFGGATLAVKFTEYLSGYPSLARYSSLLGYGLVVLLISYFTLIVGELVPKRLAYGNPEGVAISLARSMTYLSVLAAPFVAILCLSTDFFVKIFGVASYQKPEITEEEIRILIRQGAESGIFEAAEHDLVERVLRLDDRRITTIMTPKNKIVWLNIQDDPNINRQKVIEKNYTRYLVCDGSLERILGAAHVKELLRDCYAERPFDPARKVEPVMFLTENIPILDGLLRFKEARESLALIINEHGVVQGIVTITDFLKAIVGNVSSLNFVTSQYAVQRDDGSWLVEGSASIERLKEIMKISVLPGEERTNYTTVAGFVMYYLDRIPREGESLYWDKWRIEVMDMDGLRIDKILLVRPGEENLE
jgi:putative hemolysin